MMIKTMLLKFSAAFVTCLVLLLCFQGNLFSKTSVSPCPEGFYYTDCIPVASGPCYPGCVPLPGYEQEVDGKIPNENSTVLMKCVLGGGEQCRVTCRKGDLFEAVYKGRVTQIITNSCPVCGAKLTI